VFYRGGDNALWTRWRDPATTPNWSDEQSLGGGLNGDPVAAAPAKAVSPVNWMAQLSGTSELSQLTLPGTHDTCTASLSEGARCQNWDLATQLQYGIRYVDIRCRHIQDVFAIMHENFYVGFNFGEGVRDVCVEFLKANPTECIVMQVKREDTDADNNLTFQQVFDGYRQGFESFFYTDDRIPTLGEVRGKIVVVRRFDLDSNDPRGLSALPWQDNATFTVPPAATNINETVTFHIQDQYILDKDSPEVKWPPVKALLDQANADASDAWYINFASASRIASLTYPDAVAAVINPQLYGYLAGSPFAARLGTLMMDFPDANMIGRIISLNTNK
jgi:1-phosphatidylinositol phosphodiesterase